MSTVVVAVSELSERALDYAVATVAFDTAANEKVIGSMLWTCAFGRLAVSGPCAEVPGTYDATTGKPHVLAGVCSTWAPSTDGRQAAPLLHKHAVALEPADPWQEYGNGWTATCITSRSDADHSLHHQQGDTPLIAGMRAIVGAILGDTVEIPTELLEQSA